MTLTDKIRGETIGNGVLLDDNWVLASADVIPDGEQVTSLSGLKVRIGRKKQSRKILTAIRHPLTTWRQYNVALLRLDTVNSTSGNTGAPCLMRKKQYEMISRIYPRITLTTRIGTRKNKLKPRRGKVQKSCRYPSYLCVDIIGRKKSVSEYMLLRGSPIYLGYSGDLNLAGIGLGDWNYVTAKSEPLFIPIWHVSDWISDVTREFDSKCAGTSKNVQRCVENLRLPKAADLLAKIQRPERH